MGLVITTFIDVAAFVGYPTSQESHEKMLEGNGESIEFTIFNDHVW
jgi:hypothetical protein